MRRPFTRPIAAPRRKPPSAASARAGCGSTGPWCGAWNPICRSCCRSSPCPAIYGRRCAPPTSSNAASSKFEEEPGPWFASSTSPALTASSTPSSRDSTWNGKTAPSSFLHKPLDITAAAPRLTPTPLRRSLSCAILHGRCAMSLSLRALGLLTLLSFPATSLLAQSDSPASEATAKSDTLTFHSTVRRVIVDVVVRDSNNKPVHGVTARDFVVAEDGRPQNILSFDVHDFDSPSISIPANAPHQPTNHFVNIPATPERGPLYVILYDLVNIGIDDQIDARRQVLKFINSKPPGTR